MLKISTITDVTEDYQVKLSNILNIPEVLNPKNPTHIPMLTENVSLMPPNLLLMLQVDPTTLPSKTKTNFYKPSPLLDQYQLLSKLFHLSPDTPVVFMLIQNAALYHLMLTTPS